MSLAHFKKPRACTVNFTAADANVLDADTVAQAVGLGIKHQGRHVELSNGIRGTNKSRMVWCQRDGTGIGDNIALAQHVCGLNFRDALALLRGQPKPAVTLTSATATPLRLPRGSDADKLAGKKYLAGRGIASAAMTAAEECGMLQYIRGAVLFVGYDGNEPKSATRRGYLPSDPIPKRDLTGSNKAFPAILPGQVETIWIVEGGVDALALRSLYPNGCAPTVIVSGGAGCRAWLDQPHIHDLLSKAASVVVACDREKDLQTQAKTDAQHELQAQRIEVYCSRVSLWLPPPGIKDAAELVERELQHA